MSTEIDLNGAVCNGPLSTGFCTACGKKAEFKCDRCGDFYCSTECQLNDWRTHRFICFPMPKLVKAGHGSSRENNLPKLAVEDNKSSKREDSPSAKSKENACRFPNGSCVHLTAFKSTNRCFIRSTNPSTVEEHERIINEINEFGKTASPLATKPKNFALALRNDKWCRVRFIGYKNKVHTVAFVDFGDKSNIAINEMRQCSPSISNLPCILQVVQLKGIGNMFTNEKIVNSLTQFTNKEYKIEYTNPDGMGGNVELFKWGSSISLNALIQELCDKRNHINDIDNKSVVSSSNVKVENNINKEVSSNGTVPKRHEKKTSLRTSEVETVVDNGLAAKTQNHGVSLPRQIQVHKPCLVPPFDIIPIDENDRGSNILIMDNSFLESGYIGCLLEKYCENLKAVTEFLSKHNFDDQPPYKPQYDEYCLAKFDGMWYRAKVEEVVSEDLFMVVYIDFTNEHKVSSAAIRRYPAALEFACCSTLCGIDGLPNELSTKLVEYLEKELPPFSKLKIDSIRKEEHIRYLTSNELLKKLAQSKLI